MCERDFYMNPDGECHLCPDGAECSSKGSDLSTLEIKKGFFRTSPTSKEVYACANKMACPGGNQTGDGLCGVGYEATLCSSCKTGYFFDSLTRTCHDCQDTHIAPAMVVVSVVFLVVVGALILMRDQAKAWSKKWLNMGKIRVLYTTCQVNFDSPCSFLVR